MLSRLFLCSAAAARRQTTIVVRQLATSVTRRAERPADFKGTRRPLQVHPANTDTPRRAPRMPIKFHRLTWNKLLKLSALVFATGTGVAFLFIVVRAKLMKDGTVTDDVIDELYRRRVFEVSAPHYDEVVCSREGFLGITRLRRNLIGKAEGKVLELACGTGVNFEHYNKQKVTSLTALDLSPEMVATARKKADSLFVAELRVGNSEDLTQFADGTFDTVVDCFGLCSYERPERALAEMQRVLKDDGTILLLQHGLCRRTYGWMAKILNVNARRHAEDYGCWWNRDIVRLIHATGLDMPYFRMRHMRTTFFVVAKKPKKLAAAASA